MHPYRRYYRKDCPHYGGINAQELIPLPSIPPGFIEILLPLGLPRKTRWVLPVYIVTVTVQLSSATLVVQLPKRPILFILPLFCGGKLMT